MSVRLRRRFVSLLLACSLAGCGPGPGDGVEPVLDKGGPADASGPALEDGGMVDGGGSMEGEMEEISLVMSNPSGKYGTTHGGGQAWVFNGESGPFQVDVENYTGFGGAAAVGPFAMRSADADYDTCGLCVVLRRGEETYMPVDPEGTSFQLSELGKFAGERFSGRAEVSLEFRQVTIQPSTYATSGVPGGKRLRVAPWGWSAVLQQPECGGHGHLHGSSCHCDAGYRRDPQDPLNCIPL